MAAKYEYYTLAFSVENLTDLNNRAAQGWKVAAVIPKEGTTTNYALLERLISIEGTGAVVELPQALTD